MTKRDIREGVPIDLFEDHYVIAIGAADTKEQAIERAKSNFLDSKYNTSMGLPENAADRCITFSDDKGLKARGVYEATYHFLPEAFKKEMDIHHLWRAEGKNVNVFYLDVSDQRTEHIHKMLWLTKVYNVVRPTKEDFEKQLKTANSLLIHHQLPGQNGLMILERLRDKGILTPAVAFIREEKLTDEIAQRYLQAGASWLPKYEKHNTRSVIEDLPAKIMDSLDAIEQGQYAETLDELII